MCSLDSLRLLVHSASPDQALWSGDAARAYAAQIDQLVQDIASLQVQLAQLPSFSLEILAGAS